jgi:hypothetical protein
VTFKELQRSIQSQAQDNLQLNPALQKLTDRKFWFWDKSTHKEADRISKGDCCFNHIIGLPTKDGIETPMFDYEREMYFALTEPGYLNSHPKSSI